MQKNKVFLFCTKLQLGNWLVKFTEKKVDRLAQLLNFTGFALYAIRRAVNFGEIDPWCQFHQRSTYSFCARRSQKHKKYGKKIQLSHQCLFTLLGSTSVKAVRRTLVKLTQGLNFINVLRAAFAHVDPKSVKRY